MSCIAVCNVCPELVSVSRVAVTHAGVIRAVRVLREGLTWEAAFSESVMVFVDVSVLSVRLTAPVEDEDVVQEPVYLPVNCTGSTR